MPQVADVQFWPNATGEMADRVRENDWASTPLGNVGTWPQSLKTAVDTILSGGLPAVVLWGPELVQIYNDGYREIMADKHPAGLGQPTQACWPEVWHINKPIYDQVQAGGTLTFDDKLFPIARSGSLEDAWFTLSYSPLRDEAGVIAGVLVTVFEVTARHRAVAQLADSEQRLRALVNATSYAVYRMSPDWSEMRQLDGHGFILDTQAPNPAWLDTYIHPDDQERVKVAIDHAVKTRTTFELEHRVRQIDGTLGWTLSRAVPLLDDDGAIIEWIGAASDVSERRRAQEALADAARRNAMLLAELQHRVRNILAVTRSIVHRSADEERSTEDYVQHLDGRLSALARTQVMLTRRENVGVAVEDLVRDELLAQAAPNHQVSIEGPEVELAPKAAEVLTLAIHELATNATKYGAFRDPTGRLQVEWSVEDREDASWLVVEWIEANVAIVEPAPRRRGFGTELIEQRVPYELKGTGRLELRAGGLYCRIAFPLVPGDSILQTSGVAT